MTELQKLRAEALVQVDFGQNKRAAGFAKQVAAAAEGRPDIKLTERQIAYLTSLCWHYRRQLPPALVPAQDPNTLSATNVTEYPNQEDLSLMSHPSH